MRASSFLLALALCQSLPSQKPFLLTQAADDATADATPPDNANDDDTATTQATAGASFSKTVTSGPTDCPDDDRIEHGSYVELRYDGTIHSSSVTGVAGTRFDSSLGDKMFRTQLGVGKTIEGMDEGLLGQCQGAHVTLVIPPSMGYGEAGSGEDIPGNATLQFEVEVMVVRLDIPDYEEDMFGRIDTDGSGTLSRAEISALFATKNQEVPQELWDEVDKDKDGIVSWEEFSGPKGKKPPVVHVSSDEADTTPTEETVAVSGDDAKDEL